MANPVIAKELQASFRQALQDAKAMRHEYLTLEHLLLALSKEAKTQKVLAACGVSVKRLRQRLETFLKDTVEKLPEGVDAEPQQTMGIERVLQRAAIHALSADQKVIEGGDVLVALFREEESHALYLLQQEGVSRLDVVNYLSHGITKSGEGEEELDAPPGGAEEEGAPVKDPLKAFAVNLMVEAEEGRIDPLIGRQRELERTVQVLCRRRKNNPIFVGDSGVGKTAIAEGLALRIHERRRPGGARRARSSTPSTWARCSPAPSSAASSRSGSRACSRRSRSSPTPSSSSTRSTPSSAPAPPPAARMDASNLLKPVAGLGRAALHRLHHLPGIQGLSFERTARSARRFQKIEVGRALGGGQRADSAGPQDPLRGAPRRALHRGGPARRRGARRPSTSTSGTCRTRPSTSSTRPAPPSGSGPPSSAPDAVDPARRSRRSSRAWPRSRRSRVSVRRAQTPAAEAWRPQLRSVIFGQDQAIQTLVSAIKLARSGLRLARKSPSAPSSSPAPPASARPSSPSSSPRCWASSSCAST